MGKYLTKYRNYEEYLNARGGNREYPNVSLILNINKIIYGKNTDFPAHLYTKPEIEKCLYDDVLPVVRYTYRFDFDVEKIKDIYLDNNNFVIDEHMSEYNQKPTYRMDFDKIEKLQNEYPIYINDSLLFIELSSFYTTTLPIENFKDVLVSPSPYFHWADGVNIDSYGYIKNNQIVWFEELLDKSVNKLKITFNEDELILYFNDNTTWEDVIFCEDIRLDYFSYHIFKFHNDDYGFTREDYPYNDDYVHMYMEDFVIFYEDTNERVKITDKLRTDVGYILKMDNNLISFSIDGVNYFAEEGMTWEEWVNSEYNTDNYYINNGGIHKDSMGALFILNIGAVKTTDYIDKKNTYAYVYSGGAD